MRTSDKKVGREETSVADVGEAITAAMPALDGIDQQIATAVYGLMSTGEPVEPAEIAKAVGSVTLNLVNERLSSWPGVFRDDGGRVVGFWGHATVRVQASDPISGEPVSLVVDRAGVREINPAGALVSMVIPDGPFGYDVIESFCHKVLFFASAVTGAKWIAEHEATTLLPVEQAFELGRVLTERVAPDRNGAGDAQ